MQSGKPTLFDFIQLHPEFTVGMVTVLCLAIWLSRIYWRRKLTKWAESQGMKLVSFRGAWFYEGPSKFLRSRNQHAFRVIVEDHLGITHSAWVMFGTFWGFTWGMPLTDVQWDNDTDY
jgi:hypothetical protein